MKYFLLVLLLLLILPGVQAQVTEETEQQLEQLAEEEETDAGDNEWMEALEHLQRYPLNINTATEEDFQLLPMVSPLQVMHLLQYRRLLGPLLHVYELQAVPAWDGETIRKLLPYISAATASVPIHKLLTNGGHRMIMTWGRHLPSAAGFDRSRPNHFEGGRAKLLLRYRFSTNPNLRWGYTAEKDAGEPFSKTVFDFHSFHFLWKRTGWLRTIALGDYTINMGQGLVQWQSLAFKKSSEVLSIRRQSAVILPYQSSGEFYFNRGAALGFQIKKFSAHLFFSGRALDGNTEKDSSAQTVFSSFDVSGLHRTAVEQAGRASVQLVSYGGTLHYRRQGYLVGINAVQHLFSLPMQPGDAPYRKFSISGDDWMNISLDYSATFRNLHFFGELAMDRNREPAALHGLLLSLDRSVDLSLLHRQIGKKYQSLFGNAFTEQRLPSNENGLYAGLRLRPVAHWQTDFYFDLFRFPWLRFRADAPGFGTEYLMQVSYQPNRQTAISLRYRLEKKAANDADEAAGMSSVSPKTRASVRLQASLQFNRNFTFRTRMETATYKNKSLLPEQGFLFYAEGSLQAAHRATVQVRMMFFETEGFNSRIYAYESDVYGFSIPALYDKGFRYYVNLRYNLTRDISCSFRFAQTVFSNRDESGSGPNLVKGNTVSDVKLQASYRF